MIVTPFQKNCPISIISTHSYLNNDIEAPHDKISPMEDNEVDGSKNELPENSHKANNLDDKIDHNFSLKQSCILYVLFLFGFAVGLGKLFIH